nr:RecName: Full=Uncharacterized protein U1 [Human herpesvirus 6 (strain Uganda-1102)]CAA56194.1 SJRF2 [Human betaherpesvirus 6A]
MAPAREGERERDGRQSRRGQTRIRRRRENGRGRSRGGPARAREGVERTRVETPRRAVDLSADIFADPRPVSLMQTRARTYTDTPTRPHRADCHVSENTHAREKKKQQQKNTHTQKNYTHGEKK